METQNMGQKISRLVVAVKINNLMSAGDRLLPLKLPEFHIYERQLSIKADI